MSALRRRYGHSSAPIPVLVTYIDQRDKSVFSRVEQRGANESTRDFERRIIHPTFDFPTVVEDIYDDMTVAEARAECLRRYGREV